MSSENTHINDAFLLKFLQGEATNEERQLVLDWLQQHAEHQNRLDELEFVWLESGKLNPQPVVVDTQMAWKKLSARIAEAPAKTPIREMKTESSPSWKNWWAIAASIVVLAGAFYILSDRTSVEEQFVFTNHGTEKLEQQLPDGSVVSLNADAEISYSNAFGDDVRAVKLKGEAFFDVERDTTKAFIVDAGSGWVKVLGTSFNVNIQSNENVLVDVLEGKVKLHYPRKNGIDTLYLLLIGGESGMISATEDTLYRIENEPAALFWLDKSLNFKRTPLWKVAQTLEELYGVELIFAETEDRNLLLSAGFIDNDIDQILEVIAATFDFTIEKQTNTYRLLKDLENE